MYIIFLPFLICGISFVGKRIALVLNKEKYVMIFDKLFVTGLLLFWFGFLVVAVYICIRDKNYGMLIYTLPFWLVGIYVVKKRLLNIRSKSKRESDFDFKKVISIGLVLIAFLVGFVLLILGIKDAEFTLIFMGGFFLFGALTFVLGALTMLGYFDKFKIDVLGIYMGVFLVVIGIGVIAIVFGKTLSLTATIESFGLWIFIPILLMVVGMLQIIKCLRNRG